MAAVAPTEIEPEGIEPEAIDFDDPEYAMPGELAGWTPPQRRVEGYPEQADRRLAALERRLLRVERCVAQMAARVPGALDTGQ